MDLPRGEKLLALATDDSTTEDERRTAAMALCRWMKKENLIRRFSDLVVQSREITAWIRANRALLNKYGARVPPGL